jgi:ribonuclease D
VSAAVTPPGAIQGELRVRPTKEQIAQLPPFVGLSLERIHVVATASEVEAAHAAIRTQRFIGFDTESKPTFTPDAVRDGPHVIQFALRDRAFIVQLGAKPPVAFLRNILESEDIVKVGFGLTSDRGPLRRKLGIRLGASVELSQVLRRLRYKQALGVKAAVAIVLGQRLHKSKSITTSNWAASKLSPAQLLYAANDAYAALTVFQAMGD